jgi:hypothetical protein
LLETVAAPVTGAPRIRPAVKTQLSVQKLISSGAQELAIARADF